MAWKLEPEAKTGGWRLEEDAKPKTSAEDITRSVIQGVTHDIPAGIAGMGGAVENLGGAFANPIHDMIYGPGTAKERQQRQGQALIRAPDPEDVSGVIDKAIPSYHSATETGQFAETAASFLPSALSPGGAATRIARVLAPATGSEVAGNMTKGTDLEGPARFLGALLGGGVAEGARHIAIRGGATPDERSLRMISKAMQDAKLTPADIQAAANKIQKAGGSVEEMMFELLGEPGLRMARAVFNVPGPSASIGKEALEARKQGVGARVTQAASKATGVGGKSGTAEIGEFLNKLEEARKTNSGPLYDAAYAAEMPADVFKRDLKPIMMGEGSASKARGFAIQHAEADITRYEAMLSAAKRAGDGLAAQKAAANLADARLAKDQLGLLSDPKGAGPNNINVRALDYFQRGMRSIAEDQGVHTGLGSANLAGQREFNALLDSEIPEFAKARSFIAQNKGQQEMVDEGRRIFETDDYEVAKLAKTMTPADREAWLVGVMRSISEKVNRGDTAWVARLTRDKNLRNQLSEAFGGSRKAAQFFSRVAREATMAQSDNAIRTGSRTTPLAEDIKALTTGEDELGFISEMAQHGGHLKPLLWKWGSQAYDRLRRPGIYNSDVNEALGKRLFTKGNTPAMRDLITDMGASRFSNLNQLLRAPFPGYTFGAVGRTQDQSSDAQSASDEELLRAIGAK